MKLSALMMKKKPYTQLGMKVLAVLTVGPDGYRVYVDAVPGYNHDEEWQEVAATGAKQNELVAKAIVENLFHPGFEVDIPYAR